MEYCKKIIAEKIQEQLDKISGNKVILRIENFEDAKFYLDIYKITKEICEKRDMDLEAKMTLGAWENLKHKNQAKYDMEELENLDIVDKKNRITIYRNQIVRKPTLVLFFGTEYAVDKAGLNELFLINPGILEEKVEKNYHLIFKEKFAELIMEKEGKRLNHFYDELFLLVPKNLMYLSCMVDELPRDLGSFDELMEVIFSRLYQDWGLPNMDSFPVTKIKEKGKIQVLAKENQFVKRSKLRTNSDMNKALKKIDQYKEKHSEIVEGGRVTAFSSFGEFEDCLREYILGENLNRNRERLCKTDFMLINEILDLKITQSGNEDKKVERITLKEEPFLLFQKAILGVYQEASKTEIPDEIIIEIEGIRLAGIGGEEQEENTQTSIEQYWTQVCRYCGGLFEYMNQKGCLKCGILCKVTLEKDIFQLSNMEGLIKDGVLGTLGANNSLSKIPFTIFAKKKGEVVAVKKYEWVFSEKDSWVNCFAEFEEDFFAPIKDGCYIPFGVLSKIEEYENIEATDDFYHQFIARDIKYYNLVDEYERKYGEAYGEFVKLYRQLGEHFFEVADCIAQKGFFSVLQEENKIAQLLKSYCEFGEKLARTNVDDHLLESYRLFVNAFLLAGNLDGIKKDLEMETCIVPSYHPVALERMKEKIEFIQKGANELCQEDKMAGKKTGSWLMDKLSLYDQISYVNSTIDLLKGKRENLICKNMFGAYGVYASFGKQELEAKTGEKFRIASVTEESMDTSGWNSLSSEARILLRYIKDYVRTFPYATGTLNIGLIHYEDYQPIISAMNQMNKSKEYNMDYVNLYIYVPEGNYGGERYLSYWLEQYFDEASTMHVQVYLQYYKAEKNLIQNVREKELDMVFVNHILTEQELAFSDLNTKGIEETVKFPMFYKPLPMYQKSAKREVELSQLQFMTSKVHTKVMYKLLKREREVKDIFPRVVKTCRVSEEKMNLIEHLHENAKWVICQDMGLDKHVLFQQERESNRYKIIGFSTGEGTFGEYNILVSAKEEMVDDLKQRIKRKLNRTFGKWDEEQLEIAAAHCVNIAKELNGSSLLKALNPEDEDIRNFLAYILTTQYHKKQNVVKKPECEIMISLDSYKHWFREKETSGKLEQFPDFLQLRVEKSEADKEQSFKIIAKLIECKLALENEKHVEEAKEQLKNGYKILKEKFNPNSTSVERKYWFAQLYQVLVFEQINRGNNEDVFLELSNQLFEILNGEFTIEWEGEIYTFWVNKDSDKIILNSLEEGPFSVKQVVFGQQTMKELIAGNKEEEMLRFEAVREEEDMVEEVELVESVEQEAVSSHKERKTIQIQAEEEREVQTAEQRKKQEDTIPKPEEEKINRIQEIFLEQLKEVENSSFSTEPKAEKTDGEYNELQTENSTRVEKEKQENQIQTESTRKSIEICFGISKRTGEKIKWGYSNKDMANRHLLITGKSGQGKTYAIQGFLLEFAKQGIPAIIFDYTEGFTNQKLNETFKSQLQGKIKQNILKINPMSMNPFIRQKINLKELLGEEMLAEMTEEEIKAHSKEDSVAVASRIASILSHVYTFGDQQYATIYQACKGGIDSYGDKMNFQIFRKILEEMETKESKSVLNKLTPFLDTNLFDTKGTMEWSEMLYREGMINVIQLTQIPRDMQIVATEFILWDMWYYSLLHGEEHKPFIVVLDEAQNLDFGEKSPSNKILTEGRKFGWSGWFATQFLKGQLKEDEIGRLQQTSQRIYFRPPDNEITSMAASIDQDRTHATEWVNKLKKLQKGNCIITGDSLFGEFGQKRTPIEVKVSSMEERGI